MKAFGFITGVSLMLLCSCATQNSIYPSLPAETALNPEAVINGAGEGNRTLVSGLGSPHSTIEPHPLPVLLSYRLDSRLQGFIVRQSRADARTRRRPAFPIR
jgi:hypothetical protein